MVQRLGAKERLILTPEKRLLCSCGIEGPLSHRLCPTTKITKIICNTKLHLKHLELPRLDFQMTNCISRLSWNLYDA
jgi:hypothetical protein